MTPPNTSEGPRGGLKRLPRLADREAVRVFLGRCIRETLRGNVSYDGLRCYSYACNLLFQMMPEDLNVEEEMAPFDEVRGEYNPPGATM